MQYSNTTQCQFFYWLPPAIQLQKALAGSKIHTLKQQNGSCICEGSWGLWLIDLSKTNSPARSACVICSRHKSKGNKALIIFAEEQKETGRASLRQDVLKQRASSSESPRDWRLLTGHSWWVSGEKKRGKGFPKRAEDQTMVQGTCIRPDSPNSCCEPYEKTGMRESHNKYQDKHKRHDASIRQKKKKKKKKKSLVKPNFFVFTKLILH